MDAWHAHHGDAWARGLLWSVCDDRPLDDQLCAALLDGGALREGHGAWLLGLLAPDCRDVRDDDLLRDGGDRSGLSRAHHGHGLSRRPAEDPDPLRDAHPLREHLLDGGRALYLRLLPLPSAL